MSTELNELREDLEKAIKDKNVDADKIFAISIEMDKKIIENMKKEENNKKMNLKKWHEKYCNEKIVDLKKYLDEKNIEILRKLGIEIEDKKYTEREFELISMDLSQYLEPEKETMLYGGYTVEETQKRFIEILNSNDLTEREKVLINMYFIAANENNTEAYLKEPEKYGVSRKECDEIIEKFNSIAVSLNL